MACLLSDLPPEPDVLRPDELFLEFTLANPRSYCILVSQHAARVARLPGQRRIEDNARRLLQRIHLGARVAIRQGSSARSYWAQFPNSPPLTAPVQDVKNAFHRALELAQIQDFTWHDLRHTFASRLIMKGASLRSVAELLGHRGLRMVLRYAHLSSAYLAAEVGLLDAPPVPPADERARKGQRAARRQKREAKVVELGVREQIVR